MVHSPSKVIAPPPPPPLPPPVLPPPAPPLAFLKRKQVMQVHDYNSGAVKLWWPTIYKLPLKALSLRIQPFLLLLLVAKDVSPGGTSATEL